MRRVAGQEDASLPHPVSDLRAHVPAASVQDAERDLLTDGTKDEGSAALVVVVRLGLPVRIEL